MTDIPLRLLDYDVEKTPILGGPLYQGYRQFIAGRPEVCRSIIAGYLVSVYLLRPQEQSTERFVREIYRERGLEMPLLRILQDAGIILLAAERRYQRLHWPVVESIVRDGYNPGPAPITLRKKDGRYLVGDGKNRCSILAALGWEILPQAEVC